MPAGQADEQVGMAVNVAEVPEVVPTLPEVGEIATEVRPELGAVPAVMIETVSTA